MRISDWSSDVCSSFLGRRGFRPMAEQRDYAEANHGFADLVFIDAIDAAVSEHAVAKIRDAIPRVKTQAPDAPIGAEPIEDPAAKRKIHVDPFNLTPQTTLVYTQTTPDHSNPTQHHPQ